MLLAALGFRIPEDASDLASGCRRTRVSLLEIGRAYYLTLALAFKLARDRPRRWPGYRSSTLTNVQLQLLLVRGCPPPPPPLKGVSFKLQGLMCLGVCHVVEIFMTADSDLSQCSPSRAESRTACAAQLQVAGCPQHLEVPDLSLCTRRHLPGCPSVVGIGAVKRRTGSRALHVVQSRRRMRFGGSSDITPCARIEPAPSSGRGGEGWRALLRAFWYGVMAEMWAARVKAS
ncbi:hypothetical protein C8Q78DRAFT_269650 [Trametes maxima]|nr:hypothetical protein C8Q78DRAFT_269650 [Trametes maxima]